MLKKSLLFIPFLAIFFSSITIFSQTEISAYDFLRVDPGARASALAGAFDTYTEDPNVMFYNPASLSTIQYSTISAGFGKYLQDINFGTLAYGHKFQDKGWVGIGVKFFDYGNFDRTDENGVSLGETFGATDFMVSLGYSNYIYNTVNYGVSVKYIFSTIAEYKSSAYAVDFGLLYLIPSDNIGISIGVNNLGAQISSFNETREKLPLDVRVGFSKRLEHLPLKFSVTFSKLNEEREKLIQHIKSFSLGGELSFSENVNLRIGYSNEKRQDMKLGTSLGISGFSTGLGLKFAGKYMLDYSLNSLGKIGSTHRVNVGVVFK
ncbi:MAG TPA: type IX secretion system protein PorQ [Ignavibacteria bacterium]|nr:type IX secretion system protein PorQ [Ignavibacteria bacterium]